MEYVWHTILRRVEDFWSITPKKWLGQYKVHVRLNSNEKSDVEYL